MPEHPERRCVHMQLAVCSFEVAFHKTVCIPCDEDGTQANQNYEQKRTKVI